MSEMSVGDCGVCIGGGDYDEPCDFWVQKMIKARKPHICSECTRIIQPSEVYERVSYKYDGDVCAVIICGFCSEIGCALSCEGRMLGCLWEDVREQVFPEMTTGCLAKLKTAAAKRFLLDKWNEWKFLPRKEALNG